MLALTACGEKGGEIEVTNEYTISNAKMKMYVTILKNLKEIEKDIEFAYGAKKTFTFDEDGTYTVNASLTANALAPLFTETAILIGGTTKKITIK
jgi:hypothetical protein